MVKKNSKTVKCLVCGRYEARNLTIHLKWAHGLTAKEYKEKYHGEVISEEYRQQCITNGSKGPVNNYSIDLVRKFGTLTRDQQGDVLRYIDNIKSRKSVDDYYDEIQKAKKDGDIKEEDTEN